MTAVAPGQADPASAGDLRLIGDPTRAQRAVFWTAIGVFAVLTLFRLVQLPEKALTLDLGIQYHLVGETARGAIPIIDFEHGWNALGWYVGAAIFLLVGGNPGLYSWMWHHVTGLFLATVAVLSVGYRLRLPAAWLAALAAAQFVLTVPPNGKYAIPSLWLLALLPLGPWRAGRRAIAVRVALGALTLLMHVDLALMLVAGAAAFDLFARRDLGWRDRLVHAAAAPAGALAALAGQILLYDALGMSPRALVDFVILDRLVTVEGTHFGYPLLAPRRVEQWLYPVTLLLPVVPIVWRRLSDPTRLAVALHLAMSLTTIRKGALPHTWAAATLMVTVLVLVAHDVWTRRAGLRDDLHDRGDRRDLDDRRDLAELGGRRVQAAPALFGLAWFGAGIVLAFRFSSLLAWPALLAWALLAVAATARLPRRTGAWASVGAAAGAALLLVASVATRTVDVAGADHDRQVVDLTAAAVAGGIEDCLGPDRRAWVVPHPLGLYESLELDDATPFYLFWAGFRQEFPRVNRMMEAGDIPTVIVVNTIPEDLQPTLEQMIERRYELCLDVRSETYRDRLRVYTWEGPTGG